MVSRNRDGNDAVLAAFRSRGSLHEPQSTEAIADALECSRHSASERLAQLADQGALCTKRIAPDVRVWWRPASGPDAGETEEAPSGTPGSGAEHADGRAERFTDDGRTVDDDVTRLTERANRLERRRDELASELEDVFERVSSAVVGLDEEWRFTHVNERAEALLGRDESALLGATLWDEFPGLAGSTFDETVREAMETRESVHLETALDPLDGWFEVDAYPAERGLSVYVEDVTDRRERERELERYERILENVPVGVYRNTPGPDGEFVEGNPELAAIFDAESVDEILGTPVSDLYSDADERAAFSDRLERDGIVEDHELRQETLDGREIWISVTAIRTVEEGQVYFDGVVQDVTARRERERELERYATLFEQSQDVNAVVDPDGTYSYLTPSTQHVLGYEPSELVGENAFDYVHPEDREALRDQFFRVVDDPAHAPEVSFRFRHADGSWVFLEATARNFLEDPNVGGIVAYTRDATERERFAETLQSLHETSRELIRSQTKADVSEAVVDAVTSVLGLPGVAVYRHDGAADALTLERTSADAPFAGGAESTVPVDRSSVVGRTYCDGSPTSCEDRSESDSLATDADDVSATAGLFVPLGDHGVLAVGWPDGDACDGRTRTLVEVLGANAEAAYARVERDRELAVRARQQEVVADLGHRGLGTDDLEALLTEAVELVAETLDGDYCELLDLDRQSEALRLRAGVGLPAEAVGSATVDVGRQSQAGYTLIADEPVVVEDVDEEDRFAGPDPLVGADVESGISVVIGSRASPWGVLAVYDTASREFSEDDALFVQSVANILANAIDRRDSEAELEDQREHLAALNNLNSVVRDINEALVEQSTREEIERAVCERLADSASYSFAWTAEVDPRTETLEPRVEAGVEGYLDDVALSVDEDRPNGRGPAGRAARSKRIHVSNDAASDPTIAPWNDAVEAYGFRSCAAIPIVHQETLYGILGVYTDRIGAFADEEEEVVAQLGEMIGHAIASLDRKQALMSDDVVEIDVVIDDYLREAGLSESMTGTISLTRTVPVGDDEFLQYGTATDGAFETVESLRESFSHWDELTRLVDGDDAAQFELHLSEPPVVSTVADSGGYVDEAVVEDGTMHITVHLPPTVDVRHVVGAIREDYPSARMVTRQQVSRSDSRRGIDRTLTTELTERQRAALEASFRAGFFEWPRESSGEEVAESLGVSAPTFHQHLRKAQQKLLGSILE